MATICRTQALSSTVQRAGTAAWLVLVGSQPNLAQAQLTSITSEAAWVAQVVGLQRIGFDDLPNGTPVSNQYAAASFSSLNGGVPVTAAESFPHSPANVLSVDDPLAGGAGGVRVDFAGARSAAGFWYSDAQFAGNTVEVYGTAGQELGSFELVYPHPTEWQFVGFVAPGQDIARIDIMMAGADRVTLDDVQFGSPVPEPGSWSLLLGGGVLLGALQRRRHPQRSRTRVQAVAMN